MTRAVTWLVAVGILVLGGVVVALEPPEQLRQGPFVSEVVLDEAGVGRNIEASIHDVRLAEVVELDEFEGWRGTTEGVWVVATVTAQTRVEAALPTSFLLIDGLEYRGSERLGVDGLESWQLLPGMPTTGVVLFEIPRRLAERTTDARLFIGLNADWRLDSVIGTTVDLSALVPEAIVTVQSAAREAP